MASGSSSSDFKLTDDEMDRFKTAMKSKEFRDLFMEYAKEISDPENKKKYEEDIIAMEKQRGQDVKLITPEPGFVIKVKRTSSKIKVFINVCTSDVLQEFTTETATQNGRTGIHISLPHCFSPKRQDIDKAGNSCDVYDVCFHPNSLQQAEQNPKFRNLLIDTIFDGLRDKMNESLDRKHLKYPKLKFKGTPQATIVRKSNDNIVEKGTVQKNDIKSKENKTKNENKKLGKPDGGTQPKEIIPKSPTKETNTSNKLSSHDESVDASNHAEANQANEQTEVARHTDCNKELEQFQSSINSKPNEQPNNKVAPHFKLTHRGYFDIQSFTSESKTSGYVKPKELLVTIDLPKIEFATQLDVDIFEKRILLDSEYYYLDIPLKYTVNEDEAKAQFDKSHRVLTLVLPLATNNEEIVQQKLVAELDCEPDGNHTNASSDVFANFSSLNCEHENDSKYGADSYHNNETDDVISHSPSDIEQRTLNYDIEKSSEGTSVIKTLENVDNSSNISNNIITQSDELTEIEGCKQTEVISGIEATGNATDSNAKTAGVNDSKNIYSMNEKTSEEEKDIIDSLNVLSLSDVHIPPYTIRQDEHTTWIDILVENVSVIDISVGFSLNEMNISFPRLGDDSSEWSLFVRFLDGNTVLSESCGFDVTTDHVEVRLEKQQAILWNGIYVGASEKKLEFKCLEEGADLSSISESGKGVKPSVLSMEGRLQQLLNEQDKPATRYDMDEEHSSEDEHCFDVNNEDTTDHLRVNLLDLHDDVIDDDVIENLSPLASPNGKKSRSYARPLLERSLSHDYVQHPRLKSILKRSRSYSGNWDGGEYLRMRNTAMSADDCYYTSTDEDTYARRSRNKSVSFSDTPIVFEFQKMSKRQWKKQMRKQKYETPSNNSDSTGISSTDSTEQLHGKMNKRKKKAEKKRNRNNSESRSEEENENNERTNKKQRKKKKKKQTNNNILHSNSDQTSKSSDPMKTPVLNNPLIFQLD